jgi:hypothetical protein
VGAVLALLVCIGLTLSAADIPPCRFQGPLGSLPELPEASGIALSRRHQGTLWAHNDSGRPTLFALSPAGAIRARIRLDAGVRPQDWEDIAVGPCPSGTCLYLADIGDNKARRTHITIYRLPEPAIGDKTTAAGEAFHATYPDGARDAEALIVASADDLFVMTKGREGEIGLYAFPSPLEPGAIGRLRRVASLDPALAKEMVTGANVSADGQWVVVRTHHSVRFFRTSDLAAGRVGEVQRFEIRRLGEPQGEGVALATDGTVYLSGEGAGRVGTLGLISCSLPGQNSSGF